MCLKKFIDKIFKQKSKNKVDTTDKTPPSPIPQAPQPLPPQGNTPNTNRKRDPYGGDYPPENEDCGFKRSYGMPKDEDFHIDYKK
jgi:hypothetical protein